jgi:hypothetical protein
MCLGSSKNIDPPPPTPPSEWVTSLVQGEDLLVRRCRGWGVNILENASVKITSYKDLFNNSFFTKFFLLQDSVSRVKQTPHTVLGHRVQVRNEMYSKIIPKKTKQFIKIYINIFFQFRWLPVCGREWSPVQQGDKYHWRPCNTASKVRFYDSNIFLF